jgi:hypothetical protein
MVGSALGLRDGGEQKKNGDRSRTAKNAAFSSAKLDKYKSKQARNYMNIWLRIF